MLAVIDLGMDADMRAYFLGHLTPPAALSFLSCFSSRPLFQSFCLILHIWDCDAVEPEGLRGIEDTNGVKEEGRGRSVMVLPIYLTRFVFMNMLSV
jgi:hypothetical protein